MAASHRCALQVDDRSQHDINAHPARLRGNQSSEPVDQDAIPRCGDCRWVEQLRRTSSSTVNPADADGTVRKHDAPQTDLRQ